MTAEEKKSQELCTKFQRLLFINVTNKPDIISDDSKQCALICCDEIMKAVPMYTGNLNPMWKFYDDVKSAIEKL